MTWAGVCGVSESGDAVANGVLVVSPLAAFLGRSTFVVIVVDIQEVVRTSCAAINSRAIFSHYRIAFKTISRSLTIYGNNSLEFN